MKLLFMALWNASSALFCIVGENFQSLEDNVLLLPLAITMGKVVFFAFRLFVVLEIISLFNDLSIVDINLLESFRREKWIKW